MTALRVLFLAVVAVLGVAAVATREPSRQVFVLGAFGLALTVLFRAFEAPDVALSTIVVGAVITPTLFILALAVRVVHLVARPLERVHTGYVGDAVSWIGVGASLLGAWVLWQTRFGG